MENNENNPKADAGANFDYQQFRKRIDDLMQKINEETKNINKKLKESYKPNRYIGLKLLLATLLMGGAATYGAYQPSVVKSVTEPIYQNIVEPTIDIISKAYVKDNSGLASESYNQNKAESK